MIDVHSHFVAPELIQKLANEGASFGVTLREDEHGGRRAVLGDLVTGLPFIPPLSDVPARLSFMGKAGIEHQILAGWMDLAGYHLAPEAGRWLARAQNETLAAVVAQHADRFVGAAAVPLQDGQAAADELSHATGKLGMRCVQIGTNVNGRGLDEPELDPLWATAEALDVPVIVHPAELGGPERQRRYFLHIIVGNPSETTFAAGALLLGGVLERFPRLRVLLVHGGGFVPYQLGRLVKGFRAAPPAFRARATRDPSEFLGNLFFDTVLHDAKALRFLADVVDPQQIMIGTDFPFPMQDADPAAVLAHVPGLTGEQRAGIRSSNAERWLRGDT